MPDLDRGVRYARWRTGRGWAQPAPYFLHDRPLDLVGAQLPAHAVGCLERRGVRLFQLRQVGEGHRLPVPPPFLLAQPAHGRWRVDQDGEVRCPRQAPVQPVQDGDLVLVHVQVVCAGGGEQRRGGRAALEEDHAPLGVLAERLVAPLGHARQDGGLEREGPAAGALVELLQGRAPHVQPLGDHHVAGLGEPGSCRGLARSDVALDCAAQY